ncbi:MAG TPA: hypothetical protein VH877_28105 [Polyangia bacterium]|jgi:hypothetical protein|nr:hypothetical protein [Polyangia bacterium]
MRGLLAVLGFGLVAGGCHKPVGPEDFAGTYEVLIEANGQADRTRMYASPGSSGTVLLDFTFGISQLRCRIVQPDRLVLDTQTARVEHSTGIMDGALSGEGTINAQGAVDLTLQVETASADGGVPADGGTASMSLHVTGSRL